MRWLQEFLVDVGLSRVEGAGPLASSVFIASSLSSLQRGYGLKCGGVNCFLLSCRVPNLRSCRVPNLGLGGLSYLGDLMFCQKTQDEAANHQLHKAVTF